MTGARPRRNASMIRQQLHEIAVRRLGDEAVEYTRAPAEGLWSQNGGQQARDDIVVYEVMVEQLDRAWWESFRTRLERLFAQQELVVRAQLVERL
jgi:hypothetical protein